MVRVRFCWIDPTTARSARLDHHRLWLWVGHSQYYHLILAVHPLLATPFTGGHHDDRPVGGAYNLPAGEDQYLPFVPIFRYDRDGI